MPRLIRAAEVRDRETVALARWLIGKLIVTRSRGCRRAWRITEVEAYDGPDDRACHASRGRTQRTAVMFEPGGVWYVYLVYGMHEMLNLVTGPRDYPAAILIRGIQGISGPGRVTAALAVNRRFNAQPCARATGLWLEDDGFVAAPGHVRATPRIGIDYAGFPWTGKPWRFLLTAPPADGARIR